MPQTIITAWEVVKYSPASDNYPTGKIAEQVYQKEIRFARDWLGKDFYDLLVADLVDYGTVEKWSSTGTYANGDFVDYFGTILKSLADVNQTAPCDDDGTKWRVADKFQTGCYENLWKLFLRRYLALYILSGVLDYQTYNIGAKGPTEWISEDTGTKSAGKNAFQSVKRKLIADSHEVLQNMAEWMEEEHEAGNCDFSESLVIQNGCGDSQIKPTQRRWALRRNYVSYQDGGENIV